MNFTSRKVSGTQATQKGEKMSRQPLFRPESQDKLNQIKFEICCVIDREMARTQRTQKELARKLCTSQANLSRVANKKTKELTFNQLFRYLAILSPHFEVLIATR